MTVGGIAVHVVQRGVDRQCCFRAEADYLVYLSALRDLSVKMQCSLHAYCLMTNHVHLLLTPSDGEACATLMRELGRRYVPYYNRRHGRTGTLWEGRFRSCLVDSREYALACHRYIDLNPVRAGMADKPSGYRWSSYGGNAGVADDRWLTRHPEYLALGSTEESRCAAYRAYCEEGEPSGFLAAMRDATNGGLPLVGEAMKLRLAQAGSRLERGRPGPRPQASKELRP